MALTIINLPLQTLTSRPKSPVFKLTLRFHNSNSRLSQPSNSNGPYLYTRQLFKVSEKAVSMLHATTNTAFLTLSRFGCLRTFGMSTTRAFRHRIVPAITVDSGSRHAGATGLWIGGGLILRQDPRLSSVSPGLCGVLLLDPKTVLIILTTTRIPGRFYRTGTVVGPCSVDDVTSTVTTGPLFSCPRYNRDRG